MAFNIAEEWPGCKRHKNNNQGQGGGTPGHEFNNYYFNFILTFLLFFLNLLFFCRIKKEKIQVQLKRFFGHFPNFILSVKKIKDTYNYFIQKLLLTPYEIKEMF